MKEVKTDYSDLFKAIQEDDRQLTDRIISQLIPQLTYYLVDTVRIEKSQAQDIAYYVIPKVIERIKKGHVESPKALLSYFFKAARFTYFHNLRKAKTRAKVFKDQSINELEKVLESPLGDPVTDLLQKERDKVLEHCVKLLSRGDQQIFHYLAENPGIDLRVAAEDFSMSYAHFRVKKYRVIKKLRKLVNNTYRDYNIVDRELIF